MAVGFAISLAGSGGRAIWKRLTAGEQSRALRLLGLKKGATEKEIKQAARKLALRHHPDKFHQAPDDVIKYHTEKTKEVLAAREAALKEAAPAGEIVYRGQKIKVARPKPTPKPPKPKPDVPTVTTDAITRAEKDKLRKLGYSVGEILDMDRAAARELIKKGQPKKAAPTA
ncbi:MAG: J domain-containing protein, partial [Planctomycetota bacterium]